jgi:hypothetical protein
VMGFVWNSGFEVSTECGHFVTFLDVVEVGTASSFTSRSWEVKRNTWTPVVNCMHDFVIHDGYTG